MDFAVPEHLAEVRRTVRDFCQEEVKPFAARWDEEETFPHEVVKKLGQLGVLGMVVPEEYGGTALGALGIAVVVEEVARFDGSLALTVAGHKLYAPKGVGALFVRRGTPLRPFALGAGHEHGLRPGTENVASIVSGVLPRRTS